MLIAFLLLFALLALTFCATYYFDNLPKSSKFAWPAPRLVVSRQQPRAAAAAAGAGTGPTLTRRSG